MEFIKEYLFKANWYDDYTNKEETSYGLVMGKSYSDVMAKIEHRLPYANSIEITEYEECDFVWMNKCNYDRMKSGENEIMFDFPDEEEEIFKCGQPSSNPRDLWPRTYETVDEDDVSPDGIFYRKPQNNGVSYVDPTDKDEEWNILFEKDMTYDGGEDVQNPRCPFGYYVHCGVCSDNDICEYAEDNIEAEKKEINEDCPYELWTSCEDCADNDICIFSNTHPVGRPNY